MAPDIRQMLTELSGIYTQTELASILAQEMAEPLSQSAVGRYITGSRTRIPFTVGWAVCEVHKRNVRRIARVKTG